MCYSAKTESEPRGLGREKPAGASPWPVHRMESGWNRFAVCFEINVNAERESFILLRHNRLCELGCRFSRRGDSFEKKRYWVVLSNSESRELFLMSVCKLSQFEIFSTKEASFGTKSINVPVFWGFSLQLKKRTKNKSKISFSEIFPIEANVTRKGIGFN